MRGRRGVSLIEFVVAATLFAIVTSAVLTLLISSNLLVSQTEVSAQADMLCLSILEEQKNKPFAELVVGTEQVLPTETLAGNYRTEPKVSINSVPDVDESRLVEIEVTIEWTSKDIRRKRTHSALKANLPR